MRENRIDAVHSTIKMITVIGVYLREIVNSGERKKNVRD